MVGGEIIERNIVEVLSDNGGHDCKDEDGSDAGRAVTMYGVEEGDGKQAGMTQMNSRTDALPLSASLLLRLVTAWQGDVSHFAEAAAPGIARDAKISMWQGGEGR